MIRWTPKAGVASSNLAGRAIHSFLSPKNRRHRTIGSCIRTSAAQRAAVRQTGEAGLDARSAPRRGERAAATESILPGAPFFLCFLRRQTNFPDISRSVTFTIQRVAANRPDALLCGYLLALKTARMSPHSLLMPAPATFALFRESAYRWNSLFAIYRLYWLPTLTCHPVQPK